MGLAFRKKKSQQLLVQEKMIQKYIKLQKYLQSTFLYIIISSLHYGHFHLQTSKYPSLITFKVTAWEVYC